MHQRRSWGNRGNTRQEHPAPNDPTPAIGPISGMFVGRRGELGDLKAALEDTISGQGRLVMLAGEPGIGKTRTAQELASYAETLGVQVLWGRCYEEEGTPPYWPWLELLRSYVQQRDAERLQSEMGPGAADIAEIVPEIRRKLTDLETSPALEPEQARFRLFSSITTFLKNATQSQSLLLVLDDLHWADRSSLLLLEFLAREIQSSPLLVLGTYRDVEVSRRHPLSETLGSLIREERFLRIQLSGLAEPEVEELIQRAASVSPPFGLSATIHRRTEGNPLFVTEIIRMLPSERLEEGRDFLTSIPEGVRDAIGRRLNQLSEGCNQVLATASIAGREFGFKLLNALRDDLTEASLLELVDEALAAHVIEELPEGRERYQFSHALIQDTLSEEWSTSRKVRLHARIGQALEEAYGLDVSMHAAELAYHFGQAEPVLGSEQLVRYSLLAGERALATYAWEEAQTHFECALLAKGVPLSSQDPAKDIEAATLLFGLARTQLAMTGRGGMLQAADSLRRAFSYYADAGDVERAVEVAEYPYPPTLGYSLGGTKLIARALELAPPESQQAGRLLSRYGYLLGLEEGNYASAQEAFASALSIAEGEHDTILEMGTLANAARVDRQHHDRGETLRKSLRAIELAQQNGDLLVEVAARYEAAIVLRETGEHEQARQHALVVLEGAERLRDHFWLSSAINQNGMLCCLMGDWVAARDFSDRGLEVEPGDPRALSTRAVLEYQVGDFHQGSVYLERLLEIMRGTPPGPTTSYARSAVVIPAIAYITPIPERFDVAEVAAQAVLSSSSATPLHTGWARVGLALMAVLRVDTATAWEQYTILEPQKGAMLGLTIIASDRLLGLLSQTMGNLGQAATHFEDSLDFCRKAGYRPELAWTCHDYADMLLQRNDAGDRGRAIGLLDESLSISNKLGMRPLVERVAAIQERAASQPAEAPAYPDGLTLREVEVLQLIAAGKTNREIADELFISVRTVGYHVGNILNKTTSSNRAEAAAYASQHGLV